MRITAADHHHAGFGIVWNADLPLAGFDRWNQLRDGDDPAHAVTVRRVDALAPREPTGTDERLFPDGFRVAWRDEAVFDVHDGTRIDYLPGPGWTGTMPAVFYSTVAALTLAWRGALSCHASSIEIAGKAVLIAGVGGAGKSTLTAELLKTGATLIGDDLPVLTRRSSTAPFAVERGRPTIRLHPDTAARLPALSREPVPDDDRGKWLVRPLARSPDGRLPLAGFVMLGATDNRLSRQVATVLIGQHIFRPRWQRMLPGHANRLHAVFTLARQIPCHGFDATALIHADPGAIARARQIIETMADG